MILNGEILSKLVIFGLALLISNHLAAKGLEDFEVASEEIMAAFKSEGLDADLIYLHKDWEKRDSAPLIQVSLFTAPKEIGDYSLLYDSLSGKSEAHQYLALDDAFRDMYGEKIRVTGFEFFEEANAFFFSMVYFEPLDQSVWVQYQLWSWPSKSNANVKCVIASDVEERVSAYYEDSIVDSVVELLVKCNLLFPSLPEEDSPA